MTDAMKVVQVGGRGWDCNQFLVKDPGANVFDVVDAGHGLDWDHVMDGVRALIDPARVRSVLVTHEHLDHVNGLPGWQRLGARLVASSTVARKLHEGHDPTSAMFGIDVPRLDVDEEVGDGDHVRIGDRDFAVLATPGHSPGSTCYWDEASGTLFAGDTLFADGGIGRFDFPDGDLHALYESVMRLGRLPVRILHSGHGPSPEGDAAARSLRGSMRHVAACLDVDRQP